MNSSRELVYLAQVEDWLERLTKEQFKSLAKELRLLEMCGQELRLPHSRALGEGLFELRERNYGMRIYYAFCKHGQIVLLLAGDKDEQFKDIQKARALLSEYGRHYESKKF